MELRVEDEGVTHINAYSKSTLVTGRILSNFYPFYFRTEQDGEFASIEAYWHYLQLYDCEEREAIRKLTGYKALELFRSVDSAYVHEKPADFQKKIARAVFMKMQAHKDIFIPAYENLPVVHYYVYGGAIAQHSICTEETDWWVKTINIIKRNIYLRKSKSSV